MKGSPDLLATATLVATLAAISVPDPVAGGPSERFGLRIPEESREPFEGDRIDLTRTDVKSFVVDILYPLADEIQTDRIYTWVNGEAASTVSELRRTRVGLAVVVDLELKPHVRLEPGENTIEIVAENERGRTFYRNWVVRLRERSHHEWFTYEFKDGEGEKSPAPPEIEVFSPLVPPVRPRPTKPVQTVLKASVTAFHPLTEVRVNGSAVEGAAGELDARIDRRVTVPANARDLTMRAVDARGNETLVRIPIVVPKAAPPPRLSGGRYLLSIGISRYESDDLPFLPSASGDAIAVAEMLNERAGFSASSTLLLTDREATVARVRSALTSFLALPGPDDLAVVYLAGFGLHGYGADSDRVYLACADTQLGQLRATALDLEELRRLLDDSARVRTRNLLLLFEMRTPSSMGRLVSGSNLVNARLLRLFSEEKGRTVLVSAGVGQGSRSRERPGGEARGLFAAALMAGLQGEADGNRDRVLTVAELFGFVSASVRAESDGAQEPRYRIAERTTPLAGVAAR